MSSQCNKHDSNGVLNRSSEDQSEPNAKKAYTSPVLVDYGDVRDVTLGPTVGIGESGNELARRNPS